MELLIVTGMSGAGKSRAADILEDIGFFCVDNMPPKLIPTFTQILMKSREERNRVAIVVDARLGVSFNDLFDVLKELKSMDCSYKILFVDADNDILLRRFQETRRKHPLTDRYGVETSQAIEREREIMLPAREMADFVIDTSQISAGDLKERVAGLFLDNVINTLKISCVSFGFKYGIPKEADLVFDVRCLPNPYYVVELKTHTGLEKPVKDYVMKFDQAQNLVPKLFDLVDYLVPLYRAEGKSQLMITVGCTGGRHRSVVFAELLYNHLNEQGNNCNVFHRDIKR